MKEIDEAIPTSGASFWNWAVEASRDLEPKLRSYAERARAAIFDSDEIFRTESVSDWTTGTLDSRRRLNSQFEASDFEMVGSINGNDSPSEIKICTDTISGEITGLQMYYGQGGIKFVGPAHGKIGQDQSCQQSDLPSKVSAISFYGDSSPYLDGMKIELEGLNAITTGKVDQAG